MYARPQSLVEKGRVQTGPMRSFADYGNNGVFVFDLPKNGLKVHAIVSDHLGWEHVSVCPADEQRTLTWDEMCDVKDLFWMEDEIVVQYHPSKKMYVNVHPFVLHLWKPKNKNLFIPPVAMV